MSSNPQRRSIQELGLDDSDELSLSLSLSLSRADGM